MLPPTSSVSIGDIMYVVIDMDSASVPGDHYTIVAICATLYEAEQWIARHPDKDKVNRGGFGIDGPEN